MTRQALNTERLRSLLISRQRKRIADASLLPAAVLIGIQRLGAEDHILLTRRTDFVETHKGQVAFPGGMMEEGEDAIAAAIREAEEEIGLRHEDVDVLGMIDDMWTPTGFRVTPVVAVIQPRSPLKPSLDEVARIFTVPLSFLRDANNLKTETRTLFGKERLVYIYDYDDERIWGVSAHIIRMFLDILPDDSP